MHIAQKFILTSTLFLSRKIAHNFIGSQFYGMKGVTSGEYVLKLNLTTLSVMFMKLSISD